MIMIARTFTVSAPPAPVRDHLTDWGNPTPRPSVRTGSGPVTTWHTVSKVFGVTVELAHTLRVAEPGLLVFAGHGESATSTDTITLRPVPAGTELTYRVELELHGLAKLATARLRREFE